MNPYVLWLESFAYIFFLFFVDAKVSLVETRVFKASLVRVRIGGCWNQKFLDYEIETNRCPFATEPARCLVGIKSFSITRLKRVYAYATMRLVYVGIKSFSITRLKHPSNLSRSEKRGRLESKVSRLRD